MRRDTFEIGRFGMKSPPTLAMFEGKEISGNRWHGMAWDTGNGI
jgi:hypothetical protein